MKKGALFICLFAMALLSNSAVAKTVSKQDLENVQKQVQQQNTKQKLLQQESKKVERELSQISKTMVTKAKQIQNIEDKTSALEKDLLQLQEDLKIAEANFTTEDKNLIQTLYALQNLALKPTESLFVQPLSPVDIIRSAMLLRETSAYLSEEAEKIRLKLNDISDKKKNIEAQLVKIAASKSSLEKEHAQMRKLMAQKSAVQKNLQTQSEETKQKIKRLAEQAKDVKELLDKLERERLAREKAERLRREKEAKERAEQEARRREQGIATTEPVETAPAPSESFMKNTAKNFAKAKGRLPMPARGPIVVSYGEETSKGVTSKGISIKTRSQAQVISPYDGSVIFAGPFRGYGKLIIIEHGDGYMSLLAGMESIDCDVGQMLLAGEPVGQMPKSNDTHLYIELRKNNKPIDPLAWIAN
ncbi:MAG: peptidoglycan DD-metalloendopeptidase family protein [Alphaproteobacteria bacterium]|nr:peptidoglycan DD-metalloendopeptidase family protein [Alphaproteobacteria bacterium]